MRELIEEIKKHRDNNNERVCDDLIGIIEHNNINSKDELLKYEDGSFTTNDMEKRMEIKFNEYLADTSLYDDLEMNDMLNMKDYESSYKEAVNLLEKCKYLILLYDYIDYYLAFPYEAYLLITNDKLRGNHDNEEREFDKEDDFVGTTSSEEIDEYLSYFEDIE